MLLRHGAMAAGMWHVTVFTVLMLGPFVSYDSKSHTFYTGSQAALMALERTVKWCLQSY